jgi:hypothetical protein
MSSDFKIMIIRTGAYSVTIYGGFSGPFVNLEISPDAALSMLKLLESHRSEIEDIVANYHDCPDCGETHPNTVQVCPNIGGEE